MTKHQSTGLPAFLLWAFGVLCVAPAQAIVIDAETENGNSHVLFNAGNGVVDGKFQSQIIFNNLNAVTATYRLEADDLANPDLSPGEIAFSHRFFNVTGVALDGYRVELFNGLTFGEPAFIARLGLVPPPPIRTQTASTLTMSFVPPLQSGDLGSNIQGAFTGAPTTDTILNQDVSVLLNGLGAGDAFSVRYTPFQVPEPGAAALLAAGLVVTARARRGGRRHPGRR